MIAKRVQEQVEQLADLVEDLEALLMYPEMIPADVLKALSADLGLATERLEKHQAAIAKAEQATRGKRRPLKPVGPGPP